MGRFTIRFPTRSILRVAALPLLLFAALPAQAPAASGPLTVAPALIKAPDDFSSTYRGYWWDFEDETHFSVEGTRKGWAGAGIANGWWTGTSTDGKGVVRLSQLRIDAPPTNWEPAENRYTPLDPAYRHLSFRMCVSADSRMLVRWHRNLTFADLDFGGTSFINARRGCEVHTVDLVADWNPALGGGLPWNQSQPAFYGINLAPTNDSGTSVSLDYVTLSKSPSGASVTVGWNPADGPLDLHFSSTPGGDRLTPIASNLPGGSYSWQTPNLAPGTYYLFGFTPGGQQLPAATLVVDAPPRGTLVAPSYTSGPDYATVVAGDPWNMSNPRDIELAGQVSGGRFVNGLYSATSLAAPNAVNPSNTGDPGLYLNVPKPIDTKKYRYLTFRMWVEGEGLIENTGGVSRIIWFSDASRRPGTFKVTQDTRVYKGWRTVSLDLAAAYLEPGSTLGRWGGYPVADLRLDPHESAVPRPFKLDWVKLTGDNLAGSTYNVRYTAQDAEGATTVEFFTSGGRSPQGAFPFDCPEDQPPTAAGVQSCLWDTSALPLGSHFVHMRLTDGAGNLTWVSSDLPVIRK